MLQANHSAQRHYRRSVQLSPESAFCLLEELTHQKTTIDEVPEPEAVKWSRAWHSATDLLQFPDRSFDNTSSYLEYAKFHSQKKQITIETRKALHFLLSPHLYGVVPHQAFKEYNLIHWYCNEIRRHFITNIKPILCTVCPGTCDCRQ